MIDTYGKLLESIICRRLKTSIEMVVGLFGTQFGFRKGKSSMDAIKTVVDVARNTVKGRRWRNVTKKYCVVVTLDAKNAFNTAKWDVS